MQEQKTAPQERGAGRRSVSLCVKVMEVVMVTTPRGKGTKEDPMRVVVEVWTKDGKLIAVNDPEN